MEEDDHHLKRKLLSPSSATDEEEKCLRDKLVEENKKLWVVAAPSIFTRFSTFGVGVISQAFIGHIGPTELAAYALVGTVLLRFANGLLEIKAKTSQQTKIEPKPADHDSLSTDKFSCRQTPTDCRQINSDVDSCLQESFSRELEFLKYVDN